MDVLGELEQRILIYMRDNNITKKAIPGYCVEVYEDKVVVEELPPGDLNQLYLGFNSD